MAAPLVVGQEALGVLITEKNSSHSHIAQSEINLLMGVASQTAISIINARSIKKIRKSELNENNIAIVIIKTVNREVNLALPIDLNDSLIK